MLVPTTPPRVRLSDLPAPTGSATPARSTPGGTATAPAFWLEITDRPDIGVDLHCPQRDAAGKRNSGYSLIWWVEPGDVVFHYSLNERAIVAWSRAAGGVSAAPTSGSPTAAKHGDGCRCRDAAGLVARSRWPFPLDRPLPSSQLRERADRIRILLEQLKGAHTGKPLLPLLLLGRTRSCARCGPT